MKQDETNTLRNSSGYKIIYKLLKEYTEYPHSAHIEAEIQNWLIDDKHQELKDLALNDLLLDIKFTSKNVDELNIRQREQLQRIKRDLHFELDEQKNEPVKAKRIPFHWYLLRVAAITLPILALAGWYLETQTDTSKDTIAQTQQTYQEQSIDVSTTKGQCTEQNLSDGSLVVLNADSKMTYSNNEQSKSRRVKLVGEAYFEVRKVEQKTFVVQTAYLDVKVLGTRFDVKAYPEENKTVITLNEGKIEVETINSEIFNIEPGQQLVYNNTTGEVNIKTVNADESSAWRDGNLYFEDATISEIMRDLERADSVSFTFETALTNKERYSLKFTGNETIKQKMSILKDLTGGFSYTIDENNIKIMKHKTEVKHTK